MSSGMSDIPYSYTPGDHPLHPGAVELELWLVPRILPCACFFHIGQYGAEMLLAPEQSRLRQQTVFKLAGLPQSPPHPRDKTFRPVFNFIISSRVLVGRHAPRFSISGEQNQ